MSMPSNLRIFAITYVAFSVVLSLASIMLVQEVFGYGAYNTTMTLYFLISPGLEIEGRLGMMTHGADGLWTHLVIASFMSSFLWTTCVVLVFALLRVTFGRGHQHNAEMAE